MAILEVNKIIATADEIKGLAAKLSSMENLARHVDADSACVRQGALELNPAAGVFRNELEPLLSYILKTGLEAHAAKLKEEIIAAAASISDWQGIRRELD